MEDDDFGDLYADLDFPPSSIPGLGQSVIGDEPKTDSNPKAADSSDKGMVDLGVDLSNYSDSDDDFDIVLNEDECPSSLPLKPTAEMAVGECDDEDDDSVVALRGDRHKYDVDEVSVAQKCDERGAAARSDGRGGWHSESHLVGLSRARTSKCGRGDRYPLRMPCFGGSSSYNQDISTAAEKGCGFSLPRTRTIFDINIEAFEQKPWRHHGVDLTDYFNFGLDEESWKIFCECMDNYRTQAKMPIKYPFYQSYQGEKNPNVREIVEKGGSDMPRGRAIQVEGSFGERLPSKDTKQPRHLDPDVVIQIAMEGSEDDASILCKNTSEHVEEACIDASQKCCGNNSYGRVFSPCYEGQICKDITNSIKHHTSKLNGSTSRGISGEAIRKVDCKKNDEENRLRIDACRLEVRSDSGDQDLYGSSSCDLNSHSEGSMDKYLTRKKSRPDGYLTRKKSRPDEYLSRKKSWPITNTHFGPGTRYENSSESAGYHLDNSRSDGTRTDLEGRRENAYEYNLSFGLHKHDRTRLKHVSQSIVAKDEDQACNPVHRKHRNDVDLWDLSSNITKRKTSYGSYVRGSLPSYQETKMSLTYKGRSYVAKHANGNFYTKDSPKGARGTRFKRNWDEVDRSKQMECYIRERLHDDHMRRGFACKGSDQSILKHKSYFVENDSSLRLAKERGDEHWIRRETEYDEEKSDCIHKERHVELMHGRDIPCSDTEDKTFYMKFDKNICSARHIRSPVRRIRYDKRSSFDMSRSSRCDDTDVMSSQHLNHRLMVSPTVEDPCFTGERGWHDTGSQNDDFCISRKSSRKCIDQREHIDIRDLQFENRRFGHSSSIKHISRSSFEDGHDSDIDNYIFEQKHMFHENIISNSQMSRHNRRLKPSHWTVNGVRFRHQEQDCISSPERHFRSEWSSRNENIHVNQHSINGHIFSSGHLLNDTIKGARVERNIDARDRDSCVSENERNKLADLGCREAVNIHMNGWKEKLARRCSRAAGEQIDTSYRMDNKPEDLEHTKKMGYKHKELQSHTLVGEGARNCQTSLKANYSKEAKSSNLDYHSKMPLNNNLLLPQGVEDGEIEEGELIEESAKREVIADTKDKIHERIVMKNPQSSNALCNDKNVGTYDNNRILETLAKMEKRKERFKEPIAPKQGPEKSGNTQADGSVAMDEVKLQRPARKRRWGAS